MNHCRRQYFLIGAVLWAALLHAPAQQPGDKLWEFATGAGIEYSPAIGADGTIYIACGGLMSAVHKLYALNPDGSKKWEAGAANPFSTAPAVASDGTIYIGSVGGIDGDRLKAYNPDGSKKWEFIRPLGGTIFTTPVFGRDGTIGFGCRDAKFFAVLPDGSEKWSVSPVEENIVNYAPGIGSDGTFYFGNIALNPDGSTKWLAAVGRGLGSAAALDDDGTIYFLLSNGTLVALGSDGAKKWEFATSDMVGRSSPVLGTDGTIYFGTFNKKLYAINPDGTKKWEFQTGGPVWSTPTIDRDGAIYFGEYDGKVYCLDAGGTVRWTFMGGRVFISAPVISEDGTVYFGASPGTLYAVRAGSPLAKSPWPTIGHDAQHTGQASGATAFRFGSQPKDQTIGEGGTASFDVTVKGAGPFQYQWRFNGTNILGATNSSFALRLTRAAHAGAYQVRVSNALGSSFSSRATLSVLAPVPFAERHFPTNFYAGAKMRVTLSAKPPEAGTAYALEDQPPAGWVVGELSEGGLYDRENHKVKFGPFFDHTSRELSYEITPPLLVQASANAFSGVGSVEGVSSPIVGDSQVDLSGMLHPADNAAANNRISIDEVTAYASAWRRGEAWQIGPNPIPIEFVTRAGTLWKHGERYAYDPGVNDPALRWVNSAGAQSRALQSWSRSVSGSGLAESTVVSELPDFFVPTETLTVTLTVAPASGVTVYAIQDQVPEGWTASGISQGGEFDAAHEQVKWGPFFDNAKRTLRYAVAAPASARGVLPFAGVASFDGSNVSIAGARQTRASSRLVIGPPNAEGHFEILLRGEIGSQFEVESSGDLKNWISLNVLTNANGVLVITDRNANSRQQFYRAVKR